MRKPWLLDRRTFLRVAASATVAGGVAGCGGRSEGGGSAGTTAAAPTGTFVEPRSTLAGTLRILMWDHVVPGHDAWFDTWAEAWGSTTGVRVSVDHISSDALLASTQAEIHAGQGHDLILHLAPVPQLEPNLLDVTDVVREANERHGHQMELCQKSSYNPTTGRYFAFAPAWVPALGNYRRSLWAPLGLPAGPTVWDDLRRGGAEIARSRGASVGLGMTRQLSSNATARSLLWSFGASTQDEHEKIIINSPETREAVAFMTGLYREAMTADAFAVNVAPNDGLASGRRSYVLNSISALRDAQNADPEVAADISFAPALRGPVVDRAACPVMYNWIIPKFAGNPPAAKEFLLHYAANLDAAAWNSRLHDLPAYAQAVPQLNGWLSRDPFGSQPTDKLALLQTATDWSRNIGYPGPTNAAEGEVFAAWIIPTMFGRAARGEVSPQQAIGDAEAQIRQIYDRWRAQGLMGVGGG